MRDLPDTQEDVMPYYEAHACLAKTFTQPQFKVYKKCPLCYVII